MYNRYCIAYFGPHDEYIIQLNIVKKIVEKQRSDIIISIVCRDDIDPIISESAIPRSKFNREDFAYVRQITDGSNVHPIMSIIKESSISMNGVDFKPINDSNKCVIITHNSHSQSMTTEQRVKSKELAASKGYEVFFDANDVNVGWIIGLESPMLYLAGISGAKTSLIPSSFGSELYKNIFKRGEVLNL